MLSKRYKHRYITIIHGGSSNDALNSVVARHVELFGHLANEKAMLKVVKSEGNITIVRCRHDMLGDVLTTVALTPTPVITLDVSGSMKRLKQRLAADKD